ncbi:outer dense fiber protein 1 isoform X1 [Corvus kubaryi]|uniref:outer dense fiber protein 1 isoform X1 n=2 Tax=Corvus kubaryi TaxID=68294 RepID=UPI001C04C698|nr:outer dense fiber protein 1 isoform X1 [Corvus kubaryi]
MGHVNSCRALGNIDKNFWISWEVLGHSKTRQSTHCSQGMAMHSKSIAGYCASACDDGMGKGAAEESRAWQVPAWLICVHANLFILRTEDTMQNLRQMQRQMRLLDMRLHLLREKLCSCRLHRLAHHRCCLHLPDCRCLGRRALAARLDMERRMDRLRRISMMLNSCRSQSHLALVDVKGFDPSDVSVIVRDGRVTVSAEHKEEHNTALGKTCNYRKFMKEFSLPPGVDEDEVTYSVESNSLMKIEAAPKCCPHLCDF